MATALTVIACYRPRQGRDADLRALIRAHVPTLRAEGLLQDDAEILLQAADGSYLEIFTWKSEADSRSAESNEAVQRLWRAMADCADFLRLTDLSEAARPFAHFHRVPSAAL